MSKDDFERVRGSGNVFRDFAVPNADLEQARTILAAKVIGVLDDRKLTVRAAEKLTGIAASEFSRIRSVKLSRFTLDHHSRQARSRHGGHDRRQAAHPQSFDSSVIPWPAAAQCAPQAIPAQSAKSHGLCPEGTASHKGLPFEYRSWSTFAESGCGITSR
jgi:hypothetical protein